MGMMCYDPSQRMRIHEVAAHLPVRRGTCIGWLLRQGTSCAPVAACAPGAGASCHAPQDVQVLQSAWVVTQGGVIAKPLGPDVARGAANTAALRRHALLPLLPSTGVWEAGMTGQPPRCLHLAAPVQGLAGELHSG